MRTTIVIAIVCIAAAATAVAREKVNPLPRGFEEIECPAGPGSSGPFLHSTPGGRVTLSWVEPAGDGHRLRFTTWRDSAWGEPRTVAEGDDWFVNWADVPSVIADDDGRMAAHWLQKSGDDTYAYDVRVSQSFDGGHTWSEPITPHRDGTQTEHGFASLIFHDGFVHLVWLDGRKFADENQPDEMTLRAARIDRKGNISGETEIDGRTCDCCPTAVAPIDGGFIVAYRDRSADEIRDISAARYIAGKWEVPKPVADDGWKINGCPVNGPAVVSHRGNVAVGWFTMDGKEAVVRAARSSDNGVSFGKPDDIDRSRPIGRVAMAKLAGRCDISWIDEDGESAAIRRDGFPGASYRGTTITTINAGRSSGYPRVAVAPLRDDETMEQLLLVWTEAGDPSRIRSACLVRPQSWRVSSE